MTLKEFYELADSLAPFSLSEEYCKKYDAYDNSGIILDCGSKINSVLFSLDLSMAAVERAKELSCGLIITHHPAIYLPIKALHLDEPLTACARAGISVLSAHFNLDFSKGGIDDSLASVFGKRCSPRMHLLSEGGYGGVSASEEKRSLEELAEHVKRELHTERVIVYGTKPAERIASFCGAGMDEESIRFAYENGADTFVSSDPKHHLIAMALGFGMNVLILTHYAAENYGFAKFYEKVKKLSVVPVHYFADERFM